MKKYIISAILCLILVACNNKDSIWVNAMYDVDARLCYLEQLCQQMNTNISSLQVIVNAMESGDYIVSVTPINQGGKIIGYTIVFAKNGSITIYNGADGQDGKDGQDGLNGQDGNTPVIGAAQDTDGIYYWTINGEWLLDANGNKIRVTGNDGTDGQNGQDGQDGQDGITPQLKIEDGMWYVSYDNGTSWTLVGQATGPAGQDGQDGQDGDSMFQSVTQDANNVYFTLADGTVITIPKSAVAPVNYEGAIMAKYSVSPNRAVYFSKGNLQYQASTDTWRFAEHQYDYVGADNLNASATYSGWIDLFGWGTSGYYDEYSEINKQYSNTLHYQPWDMYTSVYQNQYSGYGPYAYDICMEDYYANFDWGFYNAISNGGNQPQLWRTMKKDEWLYMMYRRGIDPITASIDGKQGLMLRPDDYSESVDSLLLVIVPSGDYSSGISMDTLKWQKFQNEGCVFIPFAGFRNPGYNGTSEQPTDPEYIATMGIFTCGGYWFACVSDMNYERKYHIADCVTFHASGNVRSTGYSVRLIKDAPTE